MYYVYTCIYAYVHVHTSHQLMLSQCQMSQLRSSGDLIAMYYVYTCIYAYVHVHTSHQLMLSQCQMSQLRSSGDLIAVFICIHNAPKKLCETSLCVCTQWIMQSYGDQNWEVSSKHCLDLSEILSVFLGTFCWVYHLRIPPLLEELSKPIHAIEGALECN